MKDAALLFDVAGLKPRPGQVCTEGVIPLAPGFDVVGEADDGDEAITQTLELEPDILLLDLQMPRLPGLEAMRAIMRPPAALHESRQAGARP